MIFKGTQTVNIFAIQCVVVCFKLFVTSYKYFAYVLSTSIHSDLSAFMGWKLFKRKVKLVKSYKQPEITIMLNSSITN